MTHKLNNAEIHVGDALAVLPTLAPDSVDSIVTDPPYGLSFMGKAWDKSVPSVALWSECLRVLKPGGHLLAFAGTRTQHRMAVNIEDAGFEIRDMIAWVYGSGFPKSRNVCLDMDKMDGHANRGHRIAVANRHHPDGTLEPNGQQLAAYEPKTEAAKQWEGWGTALKPGFESLTYATKPLDLSGRCAIMIANLTERIESCKPSASNAEKSSTRFQAELQGEKTSTVPVNAATRTGEAQANETATGRAGGTSLEADTSASMLESDSFALNTLSSWRRILEGVSEAAKTSTTSTAFETTIDWRILSFCLLEITQADITKARFNPSGLSANALRAVEYLTASLACCANTLALSALAPAMSREADACRGVGVSPNLDPCIMARKPLAKGLTVAANVLQHGTGAINVDGCRVECEGKPLFLNGIDRDRNRSSHDTGGSNRTGEISTQGRWPSNLIHDGSDEAVGLFPVTTSGDWKGQQKGVAFGHNETGKPYHWQGDTGSAARFFYCAKASKRDRDEGCEGLELSRTMFADGTGLRNNGDGTPRNQEPSSRNHHCCVKPTALMRYLCRLVTPPGGTVLDCFAGSGSTGKAAIREGFRFVGIEIEPESAEIAVARIRHESAQRKLDI